MVEESRQLVEDFVRNQPLVAYASFAFAMASGFYSAVVWFGNNHLSQEAKENLTLWLWGEYESTWSHHFCNLFDAVFGERHLSIKCFLRSSIASVLTVILLYVLLTEILDVMGNRAFGELSIVEALILGAAINVIPDYLSLYETRWLLKRFERVKSVLGQVAVLLVDAVFTGAIIVISINAFQLIKGEEALSAVEMLAVFSVFSVFFYSTFATSIWAWVYCLSTWVMRLFARGSLGRVLDVEKKPMKQVALVGAIVIFVTSLSALPVFSTDGKQRGSKFDEALCAWFGGGVCLQIARYTGDDDQAEAIMVQYCASVSDEKCGREVSTYFRNHDDQAAKVWQKSCDAGHARGCRAIGWMYDNGRGVDQSSKEAVDLYWKACDLGDPGGCSNLGLMYQYERGVEPDAPESEAIGFYRRACPEGEDNAEGCSNLGWMFEKGLGVSPDPEKAAKLYRRSCNGGDARGCGNLGWMYQKGYGVDESYTQAIEFYRKACPELEDEVDARGCSNLGWMYDNGRGVQEDDAKAADLYRMACDRDHAEGCGNLGVMYREGNGVTKSEARAAVLFRQACPESEDKFDSEACINLGLMHEAGVVVKEDLKRASNLYSKVCLGGEDEVDARGCGHLGRMYFYGRGVPVDEMRAVVLFRQACDGKDATTCFNLGLIYERGSVVERDDEKADAFYRRACKLGYEPACER